MSRSVQLAVGASIAFAISACGDGCGCEPEPTPPTQGTGLHVTEANVRACDAVFSVTGDEVPGVVFGPAVTGEFIPQAPRFAVSFVSNIDNTLVGQELATFRFTRAGNEAPSLVEARCFDASGAAVAGNPLALSD